MQTQMLTQNIYLSQNTVFLDFFYWKKEDNFNLSYHCLGISLSMLLTKMSFHVAEVVDGVFAEWTKKGWDFSVQLKTRRQYTRAKCSGSLWKNWVNFKPFKKGRLALKIWSWRALIHTSLDLLNPVKICYILLSSKDSDLVLDALKRVPRKAPNQTPSSL